MREKKTSSGFCVRHNQHTSIVCVYIHQAEVAVKVKEVNIFVQYFHFIKKFEISNQWKSGKKFEIKKKIKNLTASCIDHLKRI